MDNVNQKTLGLVLTILGVAFFVMLMGNLLFRVVGGFAALTLANYGMQMQNLPPLHIYLLNLINFKR